MAAVASLSPAKIFDVHVSQREQFLRTQGLRLKKFALRVSRNSNNVCAALHCMEIESSFSWGAFSERNGSIILRFIF